MGSFRISCVARLGNTAEISTAFLPARAVPDVPSCRSLSGADFCCGLIVTGGIGSMRPVYGLDLKVCDNVALAC